MLQENDRMPAKERWIVMIFCIAAFLFIFVFFTEIHPILLFSPDDWQYISYARHAVPLWGAWNPTKVFPGTFMPLCGDFAAFVVYPLTGDYLGSFTIVNAAVVSAFITMYLFSYGRFLYYKRRLPLPAAILLSGVFFLLHFLIFRSSSTGNEHMFYAHDANCYYNYIIPNMLNSCLVLFLMTDDILDDAWRKCKDGTYRRHPVRNGFLILAFYLALFSNLFCSVILAAYIGCQLLAEFRRLLAKRVSLGECVHKNTLRLLFMSGWVLLHIWEANGGRAAKRFAIGDSLLSGSYSVIINFASAVLRLNKTFMLFAAVVFFLFAAACLLRHKRLLSPLQEDISEPLWLAAAGILSLAYIMALCVKAGPSKMSRPDVLFSVVFYGFMIVSYCASYLMSRYKTFLMILPLLAYLMLCEVNTDARTFKEMNTADIYSGTSVAITEDMIGQILAADAGGGGEELRLFVPVIWTDDGNSPLRLSTGSSMAEALYKHGLTGKPVTVVEVVPTMEKNRELGIDGG